MPRVPASVSASMEPAATAANKGIRNNVITVEVCWKIRLRSPGHTKHRRYPKELELRDVEVGRNI